MILSIVLAVIGVAVLYVSIAWHDSWTAPIGVVLIVAAFGLFARRTQRSPFPGGEETPRGTT